MMTTRTGATSYQRAFRHLLNSMLGTKWQKDSSLAVTLADPWVAFASLFRFLGVGSEIRLVATKL
jgi:hypothetical protein